MGAVRADVNLVFASGFLFPQRILRQDYFRDVRAAFPGACFSRVPVTGAMLLQQRLLSVSADPIPWGYFAPVLGSLAVWVGLALVFAAWQFRREGVLFREAGPPPGLGVFRRLFKRGAA